jgi:hypothetical protein
MKAFPFNEEGAGEAGMDLRDYFASLALAGAFVESDCRLGAWDNYKDWYEGVAKHAYGFADAMMEARKK